MPSYRVLRFVVALLAFCAASARFASAAETGEQQYATYLRSINPHLQIHQSLAFARSVFADAERANLDPRLIVALVTVESHWRPNAISRVGARGLGQLMPSTAATLGVNAWDPMQNIRGAATYLRAMMNHFAERGSAMMPLAIGAYNAGPKAVDRYHGIPPFEETRNYVRKVLTAWRKIKIHLGDAPSAPLTATTGPSDIHVWLAHADASALPVSATGAGVPAVPAVAGPADAGQAISSP